MKSTAFSVLGMCLFAAISACSGEGLPAPVLHHPLLPGDDVLNRDPASAQTTANSETSDGVEVSSRALFLASTTKWPMPPAPAPLTIAVCWENPPSQFIAERAVVKDSVEDSWPRVAAVKFTGWQTCPVGAFDGIRVLIDQNMPSPSVAGGAFGFVKFLGKNLKGVADGMHISPFLVSTGCQQGGLSRETCIKATAVHEFGHALGFDHEENRSDARANGCDPVPGVPIFGDEQFGSMDQESVMATRNCNFNFMQGNGLLSSGDLTAAGRIYGLGKSPMMFFDKVNGGGAMARLSAAGDYEGGSLINGLGTGITHVVGGKNNSLLFYKQAAGTVSTGLSDAEGNYIPTFAGSNTPGAGFTHLTAVNNGYVFFYNKTNGTGRVGRVNAKGQYNSMSIFPVGGLPMNLRHVIGTKNGAVLMIDDVGNAWMARVNSQGTFQRLGTTPFSNVGVWAMATSVNQESIFFYNPPAPPATPWGTGAVAVLQNHMNAASNTVTFGWSHVGLEGFSHFTHVEGARNGALLLLNLSSYPGWGFVSTVDANGRYANGPAFLDGLWTWSHVPAM
jgi:hypothetical protein